jgi:lipase
MNSQAFLPECKILVPVAGGELAVFRYGSDSGKPILAIHGVTSTNRAWQLLSAALVPHGYTLYAVDLRGRGDSNALPGPFGMESHARDMVAVIDHLGFEKIDVIGGSMGAFVAVAMLGLAPERIARTVLGDGGIPLPLPAGFTVEQVLPYVLGPALARLAMTFESHHAYRDYWKSQPAFSSGWSSALDEYVDYDLRGNAPLMYASTNKKAVEEDSIDLFGNELIENTLRNLTQEVLMLRAVRGLQNEETPLYPEDALKAVLRNYPKIKLITVPNTNHYELLIEQIGADACANLIYGIN